ncbi:hypothetical protein FDA94_12825 [Herbidospora galbida]|uniref:Uncharacterized protein n=1 Tax=Herbidospora galbida TaxID=2575442 RepID=A0A4U3MKI2_9ACTN|nr:hypothetical protein [Herbidospora galbida]TKK88557.1 hypothetical protein FDA94_12825 [Herbidospora galbida]
MKRTLALGGVAAGLLASALVTQPASAAGDVASTPLAATGIQAKNIAAFWLTENAANLVNATPYDVETQVASKHVSTGGPTADTKPGVVPAIGDEKKTTSTSKNVNLPKTTGKVFFADGFEIQGTMDDFKVVAKNPHWCSATSVQSNYRNLVATAGSCVYDTESNKATMNHWVFVPGYYQGKTPWGVYVGKQAFTHYDYDVYEDGDRNYAFVTVYNGLTLNGPEQSADVSKTEVTQAEYKAYWAGSRRLLLAGTEWKDGKKHYYVWKFKDAGRLGDNVGGQGIAYNQKVGQSVYVFGYPSGKHLDGNQAYTGKTLKWSYGKTFAAGASAIKAEELIGVKSSFTGEGSLGSAWISQYKSARRLGYLNGVTIGVSDTDKNKRFDTSVSPYFDGETYGVYKAAANLWTGSIA